MSYEEIDDSGRQVTLRKRTWCEWCGEWMEAGEVAVHRTYKWDGELTDARQHPECHEAMLNYFSENTWEDEFEPGQMLRGDSRHPDSLTEEEWDALADDKEGEEALLNRRVLPR